MLDLLWLIFLAPIEYCMQAVLDGGYALMHSYGLALIGMSVVAVPALPFCTLAERRSLKYTKILDTSS